MMFSHPEDEEFFIHLLTNGDKHIFDQAYRILFDFRDPALKRKEINVKKTYQFLYQQNPTCGLHISPQCDSSAGLEVEHLIPISSNKLNKNLRHIKPPKNKKVPTQSLGSNHLANLILACKRCNSLKKHRLPDEFPQLISIIKQNVFKHLS